MRTNRAEISAHKTRGTNEWAFSYTEQPTRHAGIKWSLGSMKGDLAVGQITEVIAIMDMLMKAAGKRVGDDEPTVSLSFDVEEREKGGVSDG